MQMEKASGEMRRKVENEKEKMENKERQLECVHKCIRKFTFERV